MEETIKFPIRFLLNSFWRYRLHFFLIIFFITSSVAVYTLFKPNTYRSIATLMNIEGDNRGFSGSSNMLQMFGLSKEKNEGFLKFTAIINSRTFKEKMVEALGPEFFAPKEGWKGTKQELYQYGVDTLAGSIRLDIDPRQSNILNVIVEMENDRLPRIIANQVLVSLQGYINHNSLTKAKIVRKYLEDSIIETKATIFETANAISAFYQTHAVNPKESMIENPLENEIQELKMKEHENTGESFLANGAFKSLNEKKEGLIKKLESIKKISEKPYFDYLQEEHQILKSINSALRQQYELAKLDDIKQEPAFQILDEAKTVRRSGPRRAFITLVGFAFSTMLAIFYILVRTFFPPFQEKQKSEHQDQRLNVHVVS